MVICLERHVHRLAGLVLQDEIPAFGDCADTGNGSAGCGRGAFHGGTACDRCRESQLVVVSAGKRTPKLYFLRLTTQRWAAWDACPSERRPDLRAGQNVPEIANQAV